VFGLATTMIGGSLGLLIGATAGFLGGVIDGLAMRVMDAILSFPSLLLAMAIALALGAGVGGATAAVVIASLPWYARRVRSEVLSLKTQPFIDAERVMGATGSHMLVHHLVPAVIGAVIVQMSVGVGFAILTIAGLGFLGLGVQPPAAEWGTMITEGRSYLLSGQWWIAIFPGLGILAFVVIATTVGDMLADFLGIRDSR
jgi:peptide/nickel transport system permease protein